MCHKIAQDLKNCTFFVIFEKCNPIAVADALSRSSTPQEVFPKQSLGHSAVTESRAPIG